MIGTLIHRLRNTPALNRDGDSLLLTQTELNREIARERIRATRRAVPFCLLTIELTGPRRRGSQRRTLIRLLHRNVRLTDLKADLGGGRFALLLVDTPEMGGRAVVDRISELCETQNLNAEITFAVHDPDGFSSDDDPHLPTGVGNRRLGDVQPDDWVRVDDHGATAFQSAVAAQPQASRSIVGQATVRRIESAGVETQPSSLPQPPRQLLPQRPLQKRLVKRTFDLVGASVGLVLLSPLLAATAVAVKLTSRGPAFYKQTREGMGGRPFTIYKIRTMEMDAESRQPDLRHHSHRDGPAFKIKDDPRVTPIGKFLRSTCIDELPQLINVIKGDMSLVGPRPLPWHESRACSYWHRRRLDVPPGLTCYWQVDKASAETFDDWMRMDLRYVDRHGLWRDLRLIARTLLVPFAGRGSD